MPKHVNARSAELALLIERFLLERLTSKLEKLPPDDPKRQELHAQFLAPTWLDDAARRVNQIQAVTHSLKPTHPDAKGSSLFREPRQLSPSTAVGTHCLGSEFEVDVVGNAAALDVYKLLKLELAGQSLLELAEAGDADLAAALSPDPAQANTWMQAFASLAQARGRPSSHTNAKQLYWLAGVDAHDEKAFHLLAPLYPTSLVQSVYLQLQDDRFSEDAKAARAAKKAGEFHARPVREYPKLAIQKLGGTKPQNISQLNSERRGDNCLLASLPPVWESADVRALLNVDSLFKVFGRRKEVKRLILALKRFLVTNPVSNLDTRRQVKDWLAELIDELMFYQAELMGLQPGWSRAAGCDLPLAQRVWLDPDTDQVGGPRISPGDAADEVANDFARWVNGQLRDSVPVGDPEFTFWRSLARDEFAAMAREAV